MSRRGVARSNSTSTRGGRPIPTTTRPLTATGSLRLPPPRFELPRSLTPPARIEDPAISSSTGLLAPGGADRRASTPERENVSSSSLLPNFLDDTNVSTIPTSSTSSIPKVGPRSVNERLQEHKQIKKDQEGKGLVAQMHAVLASVERYEEQKANKSPSEQATIDKLKLEMAKEEELIEHYNFCLETIPSYIKVQATVDNVKGKRDRIHGILNGSDDHIPCTEEETARIREHLKNLKNCLDRVKSALVIQRISLPFGEFEKALKQSAQIFERINDHKQINRGMRNITRLVTLMDQMVLNMDKSEELLEEKDRLSTHLSSLRVSMMLYRMKSDKKE